VTSDRTASRVGRATAGRIVAPTPPTCAGILLIVLVVLATATFLLLEYPSIPDLIPVHFNRRGMPDGWQYRTVARVLLPVGVQGALAATFVTVALLLLWRPDARAGALDASDMRAAAAAAEAVVLMALIWVTFQAYGAFALARLWVTGRATLPLYNLGALVCAAASLVVAVRANRQLGRPQPRPFVAAHWRLGQLYKNPADPALFVPTRDGRRWTLNFGRPVAGALLGLTLVAGVLGPTALIALALR
jgi:uncharacterized membrane protein